MAKRDDKRRYELPAGARVTKPVDDEITPLEIRTAMSTSTAAQANVADLRRTLDRAIDEDKQAHMRLESGIQTVDDKIEKVSDRVEKVDDKVDALGKQVTSLVGESAGTAANVERLLAIIEPKEIAKVRLDTAQQEAIIVEGVDKRRARRELLIKIATFLAPIMSGAIVYFMTKC